MLTRAYDIVCDLLHPGRLLTHHPMPAPRYTQGCVVLTSSSGDVSGMLHPGDCMGQLALLPDLAARRRPATATALRPTDVVALAGRDLALACRDHPASGSLVQVGLASHARVNTIWLR